MKEKDVDEEKLETLDFVLLYLLIFLLSLLAIWSK